MDARHLAKFLVPYIKEINLGVFLNDIRKGKQGFMYLNEIVIMNMSYMRSQ